MTGYKCWFYDLNGNRIDFVDKLKDIGNFTIPKPNYVNFMKYASFDSKNPNTVFAPKKVHKFYKRRFFI